MDKNKIKALAEHFDIATRDIDKTQYKYFDHQILSYNGEGFIVLTESEEEALFNKKLDKYVSDIIKPKIDQHLWDYFDFDALVTSVCDSNTDERARVITGQLSELIEVIIGKTTYYIFYID